MSRNIITGLDIGTNSIKALVVQKTGTEWEVLAYAERPSFGLRRGVVAHPEEVTKNIQLLLAGLEQENNIRINSVFVNIGGSHLYVMPSDGIISVSRADQRISAEDVDRVLQATKAINIPSNEDILEVFPKEYIVDDQKGIQEPENLSGKRLEAKVLLLCYFQSYFMNLSRAVLDAKLQINNITPSPLAAAEAVLTRQQKELGVALIDIGSDTTSLAVYEEGALIHLAIFPLGSANITKDIAIGLKTEFNIAEDIKKQHGTCLLNGGNAKKLNGKIEVFDKSSSLSFTEKELVNIIEPRVAEIMDLMQKELKKIGRQELLPGGIVLTGGGAKIPKIKELVKQQLKLTCEIGKVKNILGIADDPALATVAGLALQGAGGDDGGGEGMSGFMETMKNWFLKMARMFRVFIP